MNEPLKFPSSPSAPGSGEYAEHADDQTLRRLCDSEHPADLAAQFSELDLEQAVDIFSRLTPDCCADVLVHMDYDDQREIAARLPDDALARVIAKMSSDDRVDLIQSMPDERGETLLHHLAKKERQDILKLSSYEEDTAGALMTSEYATLSPHLTARQAIDKLRLEAPDKETIYYAYVIDVERRLIGLVSLRELILARPDKRIEDIMRRDPICAKVHDDQEEVARQMAKYDLLAIPVTNGNDALVGIITFDDVHDVIEEEATEDFHRMGSISPGTGTEDLVDIGLRDASSWLLIQKRLPWLLALVFMNIFSGAGIAYYEDTIQATVALVFFLPLLIGSGGNAGAQSATLMVRALAIGDVMKKDWFRLLGKEIGIALSIGVCMGIAVSLIGIFRGGPDVAVIVALAMVCVVLFGSLLGMSLPFLLTRLNLDPATASAPLVTSIADIGGVVIYFGIATWYLNLYAAA
ncbi:MAG: magnesium transporter [Thermodesulfobacteriota bacterium]